MLRSLPAWTPPLASSAAGEGVFSRSAWRALRIGRARVARAVFPPEQVAEVKAIACELPAAEGLPLSRFTRTELHSLVLERGLTEASASTIWRWLHENAIKPWQVRSWLFVRDPDFRAKAAVVHDLYARRFEGRRLRPDELFGSSIASPGDVNGDALPDYFISARRASVSGVEDVGTAYAFVSQAPPPLRRRVGVPPRPRLSAGHLGRGHLHGLGWEECDHGHCW